MTHDNEKPALGLGGRIRHAATKMLSELGRQDPSDSSPEMISGALAQVLERWGSNPTFGRLVGGVRNDVLTGPGELVEVTAHTGVVGRLGHTAELFVGERSVGEFAVPASGTISAPVTAPGPGLHPLKVEIRGEHGVLLADLASQRLLQVAGGRPVALVDAALFTGVTPAQAALVADALRELSDSAFELAYFDAHHDDRYAEVHAAVERLGLPSAAILSQPAREEELRAMGVDFSQMLASMFLGRLRAQGVPVTTILSQQFRAQTEGLGGVRALSLEDALAAARDGELEFEAATARDLLRDKGAAEAFDWRLDQTTQSRRVEGNAFHAEFDNAKARAELFAAIAAAQSTIHMQVYILRPSRFTDLLVTHLIRRAREGVVVRLMVDALYSEDGVLGRVNQAILSLRQEPNIEVMALAPIDSRAHVTVARLKKRDHRKMLIVDGKHALVSGRNASDEYYFGFDEVAIHDHSTHESIPWLDAHVRVTGPLVAQVQATFVETWHEQGGAPIPNDDASFPSLAPVGDAAGRLVVHRGLTDANGLAMYEAMLDSATSHVYVVNDFPFVPAIERAMRRAVTRGVRVCVLTGSATARRDDGSFFTAPAHRTMFEYMVKAKLEPLMNAGVEVYEFRPPPCPTTVSRGGRVRPYVHAKVVSVDGRVTSIGSANLDATASYWESEANIMVEDASFARSVETVLEGFVAGSLRIDTRSAYWKSEAAQRATVAAIWPATLYS